MQGGDDLALDRVERFLADHIVGFRGPLAAERFAGGQSNPTYRLRAGSGDYVLRKKTPGSLLPSAHAVDREFRVMRALATTAVPVPEVYALCEDDAVTGSAFYVMEHLDGRIFWDQRLPGVAPDERRAMFASMNRVIAALHSVDYAALGLEDFGRPDGYLERQVPRWLGQLERYKTRDLPEVDEAGTWLAAHTPAMQAPTVIHGDYKLDNVMFAPRVPVELVAVVDWEQSTIGDPLVDLGWVIGLWSDPGEAASLAGVTPFPPGADVPTRKELIARYGDATGRDLTNLAFYCVLGLFKLACVMEGSFARFKAGTSDDAYFAALEVGVPALARRALEFAAGDA